MKDELVKAAKEALEIASNPFTYGVLAGFARWRIGDKAGGIGALVTYVLCSVIVAWATYLWMLDEGLPKGKSSAFIILLALVGKDLLIAVINLGLQFRNDPIGIVRRVKEALTGGGSSGGGTPK